ncbi:hypothetical protein NLI96_g6713 [Meripilus lineatus]|uniref:HMA domain-containing protein n=1 Tax=Meripilus lineatus TaxID=2056292 RepID=A0AAD5YDL7_9APHY|nr:hypothetical protein NLI96_g6713 [Physisporinus lineatus]
MGADCCREKHNSPGSNSSLSSPGLNSAQDKSVDKPETANQCLNQLARAICADDDGHIHPSEEHIDGSEPKQTNKSVAEGHKSDDDCTCCGSESTECASLHDHNEVAEDTGHHAGHSHGSAHHGHGGNGATSFPKQACEEHISIAKIRQRDALAAFGCVCRAMLARGWNSCCTTQSDKPRVRARKSIDSCCSSSTCGGKTRKIKKRPASINTSCADSCCGDKSSIAEVDRASIGEKSCCGDSDCGKSTKDKHIHALDVAELGTADPTSPPAHAVLAVKGMTCTGCENKLIRTLRAIPAITNVKTSLVLSRAEFDYRGDDDDLVKLIQIIEKRTGFSTEQTTDTSARALELNVEAGSVDKLLALPYPEGATQLIRVDKRTVRVIHDSQVVGSRDIMKHYSQFSPTLAPEPRDPALTAGAKHIRQLAIRSIVSSLLTIPVLVMTWAPLPDHPKAYAITSLVLASIVQTMIAGPFYSAAFKSLFFSRIVETDMLIVLSTTTAYVYSVVAFAYEFRGTPLSTGEFFETSTLLVTLIMVGQLISAFARQRAIEAISLRSLQQTNATLVLPDGKLEEIDARLLQYGDTFLVPPDSSIITDGTVVSGRSEVDESMMTGESLPVEKKSGSTVIAGTNNGGGTLKVRLTRLPGENTISDIANMVDDARFSRARIQETVDLVCGYFVPVVLILAILTFVIWIAIGIKVRKQSTGEAVVSAITYAIAVLAVSCPCAIGLAVPMVILVASGVAANKLGLIFKSAVTIEQAKNINHVVFDKTGTLTMGKLAVVQADFPEIAEVPIDVRSTILGLLSSNKHPISRSIATYLTSRGVEPSKDVEKVEMITGKGVQATVNGDLIQGGNPKWLNLESHALVEPLLSSGYSVFCVTLKAHLIGVFGLSDTIRPETAAVVSRLRERNIHVSILSGDHKQAVQHIAKSLDIPMERARSGCLPADKQEYIRSLCKCGEKVLFCGDGTNDAIALAQADIGVHMQSTASTSSGVAASTAADVVLIHPTLTGILALLELSEAVNKRIVANFVWSGVYNLIAILLAAGAFVNVRIAPAYAGLGEMVSVVPVVLVALQLKWFKSKV